MLSDSARATPSSFSTQKTAKRFDPRKFHPGRACDARIEAAKPLREVANKLRESCKKAARKLRSADHRIQDMPSKGWQQMILKMHGVSSLTTGAIEEGQTLSYSGR
jgi:hypothetical protein